MPAFTSRRRHGGRWWGIGTTAAAAVVALLFVALAGAAKPPPPPQPSGPFPVPNGPLSVAAGFEGNDANTPPENAIPTNSTSVPTSPGPNGGGYTINFDWNSFAPVTWEGTAPYQDTNSTDSSTTPPTVTPLSVNGWTMLGLTDDQKSTTDTGFSGGVKQDDSCAAVSGGSAPNKDDLKRAYLATKKVNGHTYLELGWVRIPQNTTSSSAHIAFEFNSGSTPCPTGSDGLVERATGDMLLLYDFTGGSTVPPHITLSRWVASGTCGVASHTAPCWGPFTDLELTDPVAAEANVDTGLSHICNSTITGSCGPNESDVNGSSPSQGTTYTLPSSTRDCVASGSGPSGSTIAACTPITAPTAGGDPLGASEFGEATVDLTLAGVFGANSCVSFGQVEAVSRSSGDSGTAAMEDLVGPGTFNLSNCTTAVSTQMQSSSTSDGTFTNFSNNASLTSGTWVRDKATVTVTGTTEWRGNVDFYLCKSTTSTLTSCDPTASNATQIGGDVAVGQGGVNPPSNGNVATSSSTQVDGGSYCWAAVFTHTSPTGLPDGSSTTGECFVVTSPTTIATNPWFYPQDRAVISASSGGALAGSVTFKLYDNSTDCAANGATGLLFGPDTHSSLTGSGTPSTITVDSSNTSYRVTADTANDLYWRVTYSSTNNNQTGSSSVCVENIGATITADGSVTFP